jgi:TRAP-type C4-dicarboxylate transport system permease small subunit
MSPRTRRVLGWAAVGLSTLLACLWAFWGSIENFHEGWYHRSLGANLAMMVAQYMLPMLLFTGAAAVAIRWPAAGAALHVAAALWAAWFFRGAAPLVVYPFVAGPPALLAVAYGLGRPEPRRRAMAVVVGLPLATFLAAGAWPAWRVAGRVDDGDRSARRVSGNGVDLVWAPAGPGWPADGVPWAEAVRRCRHLSADGTTLAPAPQDLWRLPTFEEAVRSMCFRGSNSRGVWDAARARATYRRTPDKESPLWDVHSKVIYWWTATERSDAEAYVVVYNGQVWPRPKRARWDYLGFRAVRDARSE